MDASRSAAKSQQLISLLLLGCFLPITPLLSQNMPPIVSEHLGTTAAKLCEAATSSSNLTFQQVSNVVRDEIAQLAEKIAAADRSTADRLRSQEVVGAILEQIGSSGQSPARCGIEVFRRLTQISAPSQRLAECENLVSSAGSTFSRRLIAQDTWLFWGVLQAPQGTIFTQDSAPFLDRLPGHDAEVSFEPKQVQISDRQIRVAIAMRNSHPDGGRNAHVVLKARAFYDASMANKPVC